MNKFNIIGTPCFQIQNETQAKHYIKQLLFNNIGGYSTAINAEKILMYSRDQEMRQVMNNSILPVPDGSGAIIALKFLHQKKSIRLDLPKVTFELANQERYRVFVLGTTEENNKKAVDEIKIKFPDINIVGRENGFFKNEGKLLELISQTNAQIVFVALGSPKQEKFAARVNKILPNILFIGCGGALDIFAGKVSRAPKFYQDNHLEWLYRLVADPRRIKRQKRLPLFMIELIKETIKKRLNK